MKDNLDKVVIYKLAKELWEDFWEDSEILKKDIIGREIVSQLARSIGSISANIEEGYGRGYGKEYPRFLKISRGSARESKGWYLRSHRVLTREIIEKRTDKLDQIIAMETKAIKTLERKLQKE